MMYKVTAIWRDHAGVRVVDHRDWAGESPEQVAENAWAYYQNDNPIHGAGGWRESGLINGERSMMIGDLLIIQDARDPASDPWTVKGAVYEARAIGFEKLEIPRATL